MVIGFKLITSVVIFAMQPTLASAAFLLVMQWYWLLLPVPAVAVPLLFWYRLRRVRQRRRLLLESEWYVEPEVDWNPTSARGTM